MKQILIVAMSMLALFSNNISRADNLNHTAFIPEGYVLFEQVEGDLNKDGLKDRVLIIKATDKKAIVHDEYRGQLDRNRRGIIVLFNKGHHYALALKNDSCFSSENEDGGVYFPPELLLEIKKGNLYVRYLHGRYGHWSYTFRYQENDFAMIGYDVSYDRGPIVNKVISINFLTKKKLIKENINQSADAGEEVFNESWHNIPVNKLIKLSEIKDFDELYFALSEY